jgi:hypothetical protein
MLPLETATRTLLALAEKPPAKIHWDGRQHPHLLTELARDVRSTIRSSARSGSPAMSAERDATPKLLYRTTSNWRNRNAPSIPDRHHRECR